MQIVEWTFEHNPLADFDIDGTDITIAVVTRDGWRYCGSQFVDDGTVCALEPIIYAMIMRILTNLATEQDLTRSR